MNKPLHKMSVAKGIAAIEDIFDSYCEADHQKYLRFLKEMKMLVDECAEGHGITQTIVVQLPVNWKMQLPVK